MSENQAKQSPAPFPTAPGPNFEARKFRIPPKSIKNQSHIHQKPTQILTLTSGTRAQARATDDDDDDDDDDADR